MSSIVNNLTNVQLNEIANTDVLNKLLGDLGLLQKACDFARTHLPNIEGVDTDIEYYLKVGVIGIAVDLSEVECIKVGIPLFEGDNALFTKTEKDSYLTCALNQQDQANTRVNELINNAIHEVLTKDAEVTNTIEDISLYADMQHCGVDDDLKYLPLGWMSYTWSRGRFRIEHKRVMGRGLGSVYRDNDGNVRVLGFIEQVRGINELTSMLKALENELPNWDIDTDTIELCVGAKMPLPKSLGRGNLYYNRIPLPNGPFSYTGEELAIVLAAMQLLTAPVIPPVTFTVFAYNRYNGPVTLINMPFFSGDENSLKVGMKHFGERMLRHDFLRKTGQQCGTNPGEIDE